MRRDARKLLEKLNRTDFAYREFEDSFSETELWPIFAAVLRDRAVVGEDAVMSPVHAIVQKAPEPTRDLHSQPRAQEMFASYGSVPSMSNDRKPVNLQEFFSRFPELD